MMHPVGQKTIPEKCKEQTLAYCPTMDLIAIATESDNVHVFRLNGQRVFGTSYEDNDFSVAWLRWKPNGHMLAIACTDNVVRLVSAFSGKTVHQLPILHSPAKISCLGWAVNFTNSNATQQQLDESAPNVSLDDLLGLNAEVPSLLKSQANLPKELTLIDVESSLPKLSTLPATGGDDDVFSSRASIDAIFHDPNRTTQNDTVDILLTGFEDGTLHLRIFDCFEIGSISVASSMPAARQTCKLIRHAFHPMTSTHALIVQISSQSSPESAGLHVVALDLNFIPATAPYYLPTLAAKSTQLQNLLRYLAHIQTQLTYEVKSAFDLPSKYLRNINETLAEHADGADFVTAAYHLVVTGECIPQLREWLLDEVGERGLKRWEKGVLVGLDTMRRIVHECLLPALERCHVVLSRLEGMSRFQKAARVLGLDTRALTIVRGTMDCLCILAHDLLNVIGKEIREFEAFLKWIRLEAEVQGLEATSERAEELREGSDTIEYRVVLDYISGAMKHSGTLKYLRHIGPGKETDIESDWRGGDEESGYYEAYIRARKDPETAKTMPRLDQLVTRLEGQCAKVFEQIAETLRKSIIHSHVYDLPSGCDPEVMDVRIIPRQDESDVFDIYVVAKERGRKPAVTHVHLQGNKSGSSLTNIHPIRSTSLPLTEPEEVCDIQFVDDSEFLALTRGKEFCRIVGWELRDMNWRTRHSFDVKGQDTGRPARVEVNGRKGKRVVCVLDEQGSQYTIFDLDHSAQDDEKGEDEDGGDEVMTG